MNDHPIAARGYLWTTVEVAVLRAHYAEPGGPALCAQLLPHRGLHAVYAKAQALQLVAEQVSRTAGRRFAKLHPVTPEIDRMLTEGCAGMRERGDLKRLALRVGRPKWWVSKRLADLGLARPRLKATPWTSAEVRILKEWASCRLQTIRRKLKAAGYTRSDNAIGVQLKRLKVDRTDPDVWTARDLGTLLGVDGKTVCDWVARRGLNAKRERGGPHGVLKITRRALRSWLRENSAYIDLRRVDQPWFWELVL